ncbi:hypothetical protein PG985_016145 [Apiospora marii]|uniref:Uncharacterized protein n=1 Tax=Apiospora marii TaxID=335849 RepID=A0ABR1S3J5_9PEZI
MKVNKHDSFIKPEAVQGQVRWPNGKASDYESGDSGFEPQADLQLHFLPNLDAFQGADDETFVEFDDFYNARADG